MSFEITRQQLLQQAAILEKKLRISSNQEHRDEAIRLKRIVQDLSEITLGATSLDELSDVTLTTPSSGQALVYNGTQWVNTTLPSDGLYSQTAPSAPIVNTSLPGSLIDGGVGYLSVPANGFKVGDSFVAFFSGTLSALNNKRLMIQILCDSGTLADSGIITLPQVTNKNWELTIHFTIRQVGIAGVASIVTSGRFFFNKDSNNSPENIGFKTTNSSSFDTTITNTLSVMVSWLDASEHNSIQSEIFNLYRIY